MRLPLALVLTVASVVPALGQCQPDENQIGPHWCVPDVGFEVNDNIPEEYWGAIDQAAITWGLQAITGFYFAAPGAHVDIYAGNICDGHNTVSRFLVTTGDLMLTSQCLECGFVAEADTVVNFNYDWATSGTPFAFDLQSAMTHEFGHWLVLWPDYLIHSGNPQDVMYDGIGEGEVKHNLGPGDKCGIETLYPLGVTSADLCPDGGPGGGGGPGPPDGCLIKDAPEPDCTPGQTIEVTVPDYGPDCYLCDSGSGGETYQKVPAYCNNNTSTYGSPAGTSLGIALIRYLRDERRARTQLGIQYTQDYYQFSDEVEAILDSDPNLRVATQVAIYDYMPALLEYLLGDERGEELVLTHDRIVLLKGIADNIRAEASPELKTAMDRAFAVLDRNEDRDFRDAVSDFLLNPPPS
ncbi:MAG: hypothetical protein HKN13_07425 [Rhodothermales bacterium]|nr:hypothetical protein [Rhodothermales bacterium]